MRSEAGKEKNLIQSHWTCKKLIYIVKFIIKLFLHRLFRHFWYQRNNLKIQNYFKIFFM